MLNELRGFKFAITLVLKFKNTINKDEAKYCNFYSNSKVEHLFTTQILICLNRSILQLWQKHKKIAKDFATELDFKDIKCSVKITDIHEIEEK